MDRLDRITPDGTKDLLFDEYLQTKQLEEELIDIYKQNGYHGVRTPAVEFFDVFSKGCGALNQQEIYTFSDYKGRIVKCIKNETV